MNNKVFIVLINYNSTNDTIECIKSIMDKETRIEYEIIVVDNNSTDNSIEELRIITQYPKVHLIESKTNKGFAGGNNLGIEFAMNKNANYILLLNNDTVIEKDAIFNQLKAFEYDDKVGIVGSRIMYYDDKDTIHYCGGKINWLKASTKHCRLKEKYNASIPQVEYTDFITGCSMMIKSDVIKKIGYLPEEYFMYYEDLDYCLKAKENGYKLAVATNSVIYHKVSASSGGENSPFSIKWMTRNRLYFIKKYKSQTYGILTIMDFYANRYLRYLSYLLKGDKDRRNAIIEGIREGRKA